MESKQSIYDAADLINHIDLTNQHIQIAVKNILTAVGEDPEREGLLRTPERVARMGEELLAGTGRILASGK